MLTSEEDKIKTEDDDGDLSRRCRFCADVRPGEDGAGWTEVWDDAELQKLVYYYTPIKIVSSSPFPSLLCPRCLRLLSLVREFFVLLNEGQGGVHQSSLSYLKSVLDRISSNESPSQLFVYLIVCSWNS